MLSHAPPALAALPFPPLYATHMTQNSALKSYAILQTHRTTPAVLSAAFPRVANAIGIPGPCQRPMHFASLLFVALQHGLPAWGLLIDLVGVLHGPAKHGSSGMAEMEAEVAIL